jgi:uncharacterized protein YdaU (DUF1376 family)
MNRPWLPLYVADYRRDTPHLSAAEHGAYLLLIMHYWSAGGLPDDDRQLSRIAAMTGPEWKRARPVVQSFFHDGWRHKRIDAELARAADISSKRSASAKQKHNNSSANAPANAQQLHTHARASSPSQSQREDAAAPPSSNLEKELYDRGKVVLGTAAGGLIKNLVRAKGGDIALARAAIETASTKSNPREYIGAIVRGHDAEPQSPLI